MDREEKHVYLTMFSCIINGLNHLKHLLSPQEVYGEGLLIRIQVQNR